MPSYPIDYVENVINDVNKYKDTRKVVKAGLIERCATRFCSPQHLHPNPADEFSQENIGPNFEIVGQYVKQIKHAQKEKERIYEEPMIVQKMEPDGYLLLNGHHRWFAALRMGISKVFIKIVNLIVAEDIERMIDSTDNHKLAVFDFDEVLLSQSEDDQAEITDFLFSRKFSERLRKGAPDIYRSLQDKGYDICVYSAGYHTEEDINDFFSMYDLSANVIINGINEKRQHKSEEVQNIHELFRTKYTSSIHVDNVAVLFNNHETKEYEDVEFDLNDTSWSDAVTKIIKEKA